jgi:hypothetical protein
MGSIIERRNEKALVFLCIQIKTGSVITSPHVKINSSYYMDSENAYSDIYLEVNYSPLLAPILFITVPLIQMYGNNNNIELYNRSNIYIFDHFYLDNEISENIQNRTRKMTHHIDDYNFMYLYLYMSINIIISYLMWSYILRKVLKRYTKTKRLIIGVFVLILIPLLFTHTWMMQNVESISIFEYSSKYLEYKNRGFLLYEGYYF